MLVGGRSEYLVSFVLFLYLLFIFLGGKFTLICLLVGVRGEAYINFRKWWESLGISKESFITVYIQNKFSLIFCNFYMFFTFVIVQVPFSVCLYANAWLYSCL